MTSPISDKSSIQQPLPLLKEKFDKAAGIMNGMNRTNEMIIELLADVAFQGKSETKEAFEDRKKYTREDVKDLERQFEVLTNMLKETYKEIEELEGISKTDIVNRETQPKRQTTTPPVVHSPSKQTAQTTSKTASQVLSGKSAHSSVAKPAPARAEPAPAAQEAVVQPPAQPPAAPAAAPPPPPPMPGKSPQVGKQGGADRSNLLDDIQKGKKLRKQPEGGTVVRQPREEAPAAPAAAVPPPPPAPPMPGKAPQVGKQGGADRSNLLDDIQKGKKLKKQSERENVKEPVESGENQGGVDKTILNAMRARRRVVGDDEDEEQPVRNRKSPEQQQGMENQPPSRPQQDIGGLLKEIRKGKPLKRTSIPPKVKKEPVAGKLFGKISEDTRTSAQKAAEAALWKERTELEEKEFDGELDRAGEVRLGELKKLLGD